MPTRLPRRALAAVTVLSLLVPLIGSPSVVRGAGVVDQALRRYPYLSDAVGPYVTINWATDRSATTASVRYGPVGSCSQTSAAATRTTITVAAQTEYQWRTELTLQPDTAYCYRVFLGSVDLLGTDPAPTFRTQVAAGSGGAFSFAVFGDWGSVDDNSNNSNQANLMSQIAASGARFAVTTGDTGYQSGSQTVYGDLVQTGHDTSAIFGPSFWTVPGRSIPLFNTQGNHGFTGTPLTNWPQSRAVALSGGRYLSEQYCCTNGTLAATYPSQWYAFDAGNSRFYVLTAAWSDGNNGTAAPYRNDYDNHWTPSSAEYVWLKHDLETHAGTHKFAFFHYPLYSDNPTENSNLYLRGSGSLEGLLAQHGVDMAFNGHAHLYQRNLPPNGGIVTYVTGGGGATPEPIGPCTPTDAYGIGWSNSKSKGSSCGGASAPTAIAQVYHFLLVTVNGDAVTVAPTDSTGRQFDVMTYRADTEPPTAPTGLTATANGSTRVDLTWTAASDNLGVTGYEVYRDGTQVATVGTVTAYGDSGLAPGTAYSYTVRARDAAGNRSPTSAPAAVTTPAGEATLTFAPTDDTYIQASQPTKTAGSATTLQTDASPVKDILMKFNLTGLAGKQISGATLRLYNTDPASVGGFFHTTATTSWTESSATWSNAPAANPTVVASLGAVSKDNWYEVDLSTIVTGDGVVSLRITSNSSNGANYASSEGAVASRPELVVSYTGNSTPDTEPPTAPTALTATANGSTRVDLTWTAASDNLGVTGYEVYRDGTQVATVGTVTAYGDSGLAPGTAYSYTVRARDAAGNRSPTSAPAAVTTGATIPTAPPAPSGLAASAGDARVNLAWNAVSAADSYSVKRATSSGGPFATIATALTATAYADTTVANGTTYWYVVSAVNGGGESANSNSASATPTGAPPPPPPPPSQPIFSDDFESGTLSSWNSSGGLTVQSTLAHQGTWAVRGATTTGRTYAKKYLPATYNEGYFRIWFYLGSGSPSQVNLMRYRTSTDGSIAYLYVATDGTLGLRSDAGGTTVPGSTAVATDAWHSLEMHAAVNGGSGSVEVWLDGGLVNDLSSGSINLGTSPIGRIQIGEVQSGRTYDVTFDDVAFATSRIGP